MQIDVRSKGIKITDDIRERLDKKLSKLDRFTTRPLQANVMIKLDAKKARVEVTIPIGHLVVRSEESDQDLNLAIDRCAEKLEKQIKNNKHKLVRSLQNKQGLSDLFVDTPEAEKMVNSAVKIKEFKLEVMSFDEAATAMEIGDHTFYVYKDENDEVCIVYVRKDGEYGLIKTH
ncbi:MAG: ribosome-associated translation inhibitor RaiA [Gammaproteobacteria bacterium]|nr:ribosome-associated translation inhibitor RaiA [Gammaproteobacteria bacterium]